MKASPCIQVCLIGVLEPIKCPSTRSSIAFQYLDVVPESSALFHIYDSFFLPRVYRTRESCIMSRAKLSALHSSLNIRFIDQLQHNVSNLHLRRARLRDFDSARWRSANDNKFRGRRRCPARSNNHVYASSRLQQRNLDLEHQ